MKKSLFMFLATMMLATTCAVASVETQKTNADNKATADCCTCNPFLGCVTQ